MKTTGRHAGEATIETRVAENTAQTLWYMQGRAFKDAGRHQSAAE